MHVDEATQSHEIIDWWLAGDGRWHEGPPPAGWIQGEDRRWYATEPPSTMSSYASKLEAIGDRSATVRYEDPGDWYDTEDPDQTDWDHTGWYPDGDAEEDVDDRGRHRWARAGVIAAVAVLAVVTATLGILARPDGGSDGESAPPALTTTTSIPPVSGLSGGGAGRPAPEEAANPSTTGRADTPPSPPAPAPSTTVGAPPEPAPPPVTRPPRTEPPGSIREGRPCAPVGATAVTANGTPVTCATAGCDGEPFDGSLWRRTTC